jgi:fatty acid desaturase
VFIFDEVRSAKNRPHDHHYTKIRGEWYDFAQFNHPGGPVALNLIKDRDATALFESHHLLVSRQKMDKILSKYKVKNSIAITLKTLDIKDDGGHYIWDKFDDDAFVRDLKQLLHDYFQPIAKQRNCSLYEAVKASPERWLLIGSLFGLFISTLPSFIAGRYWTLFATPQFAWILIANYWHDSLHFSLSSDWRVNAFLPYLLPLLSSPWIWYHQHVLGHHSYTNIGLKDPDLAHAPQLLREHKSISWKKLHQNQGNFCRVAFVWSIAVSIGLNILNDIKTNLKSSYNNVVPFARLTKARLTVHILGRCYFVFIAFLWPFLCFPPLKAFIWTIVPNISFSLSFMINSQINHLTKDCAEASDENFLKHQVLTAQNFGCSSWFCGLYSGHLNYQIEHHLFPFVNHCHLPHLAPSVEEICKRHKVVYNKATGYVDALQKYFDHTKEMSRNN